MIPLNEFGNRMQIKAIIVVFFTVLFSASAAEVQGTAIVYRLTRGVHDDAIGDYVERVFNDRYSILKKRNIDPQGLVKFRNALKPIISTEPSDNFCGHDPGFAITIFRRDKVVYEASYCFKCQTVGKATESGWNRLAMSGTPKDIDQAKRYLSSLFGE